MCVYIVSVYMYECVCVSESVCVRCCLTHFAQFASFSSASHGAMQLKVAHEKRQLQPKPAMWHTYVAQPDRGYECVAVS